MSAVAGVTVLLGCQYGRGKATYAQLMFDAKKVYKSGTGPHMWEVKKAEHGSHPRVFEERVRGDSRIGTSFIGTLRTSRLGQCQYLALDEALARFCFCADAHGACQSERGFLSMPISVHRDRRDCSVSERNQGYRGSSPCLWIILLLLLRFPAPVLYTYASECFTPSVADIESL